MWEMNWIAVIGAAVAGFVIGGIWYGPLFSKAWQAESGLSDESIKGANMPMIFGLTFVLNLVSSFILGHVMATYGHPGLHIVDGPEAFGALAAVAAIDAVLLFRFFAIQRRAAVALTQSFSQ